VSAFVEGELGRYTGCPANCVADPDFSVHVEKSVEIGTFDCNIPLPGDNPRHCPLGGDSLTIVSIPVPFIPGLSIDLRVGVDLSFDANGTPITSQRIATTAGGSVGGLQKQLSFGPTSPVTLPDEFTVPCTEPAGMDFFYKLTNNSYTVTPTFTAKVRLFIVGTFLDVAESPDLNLWTHDFHPKDLGLPPVPQLEMKGPDIVENLGPLQPDNRPPVVGTPVAPDGDEGAEIQFHVDATDNCGPPAVRWTFSDGGIGFGTDPKHRFADNGHYTGVVSATDDKGNSTTKTFALDISNLNPADVDAGPDTTEDWGRNVAFNGQATDPGSADQPTLQWTWTFGDGTPSASGGPNVVHAYATPGDYTATLKVCDKNAGCTSDTRIVHVTKRDTTTSYLGDTAGTFDTPASLSASLVDEYGQTVNGRSISFGVGSDSPLTALTSSSGIAVKQYTPTLGEGSYTGSSSFVGDPLYNASASSNGFAVAKKTTTTTYTGATTGGANKTIVLSAVLKDATGKPLSGRTIAFQLGTQTASAITNASGVASTSLKLDQKNGTYAVSATYAAGGADGSKYVGSSQGTVFKLQAK